MATKQEKNYTFIVKDGRATVSMKVKGKDGLYHSAQCEYPFALVHGGKKMTRKQVEEYLLAKVVNA